MSAILKFDFQKRKQLRFSGVNYLNYTKKDSILHVTTTFSLKQGETRASSGPIPHPLIALHTRHLQNGSPTRVYRKHFTPQTHTILTKFALNNAVLYSNIQNYCMSQKEWVLWNLKMCPQYVQAYFRF